MGLVCDSLNMCRKREEFVRVYPEFAKTLNPDFCPFCGKKWYTLAIIDDACLTIKSSGRDTPVIVNHPPVCTKCMKCHWPNSPCR